MKLNFKEKNISMKFNIIEKAAQGVYPEEGGGAQRGSPSLVVEGSLPHWGRRVAQLWGLEVPCTQLLPHHQHPYLCLTWDNPYGAERDERWCGRSGGRIRTEGLTQTHLYLYPQQSLKPTQSIKRQLNFIAIFDEVQLHRK